MRKILVVMLTVISTSMATTAFANQGGEDQLALLELESDYMVLINQAKRNRQASVATGDEPECE